MFSRWPRTCNIMSTYLNSGSCEQYTGQFNSGTKGLNWFLFPTALTASPPPPPKKKWWPSQRNQIYKRYVYNLINSIAFLFLKRLHFQHGMYSLCEACSIQIYSVPKSFACILSKQRSNLHTDHEFSNELWNHNLQNMYLKFWYFKTFITIYVLSNIQFSFTDPKT
jgi:hypothetical protein